MKQDILLVWPKGSVLKAYHTFFSTPVQHPFLANLADLDHCKKIYPIIAAS